MTPWFLQNICTAALLLTLAASACLLSRREAWRIAVREIRQKRLALLSACILALYGAIAVLDSVGWCRPLINPESGERARHSQSGKLIYDQGASLLDRLLSPLSRMREKTYSAPLSQRQFSAVTDVGPDGRSQRLRPALNHPGRHLMGTDRVGIDVFYQGIKSIRTGMIIGLLTTLLAVPFAILLGVGAGYFGGWIDDASQYLCAVLSSIPTVLFIAAFMIIFGQGLPQLCLAMGIASWTGLYRLLRGETLRLRDADFVQAAMATGVPVWRVLSRHIIPNLLHLVLITTVLRFSNEVLAEAALTYLGIGVGAETMSWGSMINDARSELTRDPVIWWKLSCAFCFMLGLVLPANIFADAVRDALDPRLRTQ
jgi:ABC-type dipeptide/oligopeptide/nickel transport system permease subunit